MLYFLSDAALDVLDDSGADSFELCQFRDAADRESAIAQYVQLNGQHPGFHLLLADTTAILIPESVRQQFLGLLGLFESHETPATTAKSTPALDTTLRQWLAGTLVEDSDAGEVSPSPSIPGILTQQGFDRTVALFQEFAGKEQLIRVQFSYGSFDVFCSELAMYRIRDKYQHSPQDLISHGYSHPSRSFWFSLKTPSFEEGFFDTGWPSDASEQLPHNLSTASAA